MNIAHSLINTFATQLADYGTTIYELYDRKGQEYNHVPLTKEENAHIKRLIAYWNRGRSAFKVNQCYKNAQRLATTHKMFSIMDGVSPHKFGYHEGYVASTKLVVPIHHAWNTINGKIVDLTAAATIKARPETTPYDYFGIEIPLEMVLQNQIQFTLFSAVAENSKLASELFGLNSPHIFVPLKSALDDGSHKFCSICARKREHSIHVEGIKDPL